MKTIQLWWMIEECFALYNTWSNQEHPPGGRLKVNSQETVVQIMDLTVYTLHI